jgi:tetratricopeptide (TPR) repeat protein
MKYLGPDHRNTLASMQNLANSYADLGRHADALKLREETLARRKATLGPDHRDTLMSMMGVAHSYTDLGRHREALQLREEALALLKANLGPDHPFTLGGNERPGQQLRRPGPERGGREAA